MIILVDLSGKMIDLAESQRYFYVNYYSISIFILQNFLSKLGVNLFA